jgi:hypothetical protein
VPGYAPLRVQKTAAIAVSPRCADLIKVALTRHSAVRHCSPTFKNPFKRTMVYGPGRPMIVSAAMISMRAAVVVTLDHLALWPIASSSDRDRASRPQVGAAVEPSMVNLP